MRCLVVAALCLMVGLPAFVAANPIPQTPQGLQATEVGPGVVDLAWATVDGATGYQVYRDGLLLGSTVEPRYTDLNAAPIAAYTVTAVNGVMQSLPSAPVAFTAAGCGGLSTSFPYVVVNPDECQKEWHDFLCFTAPILC